jgi:hypothetical protein
MSKLSEVAEADTTVDTSVTAGETIGTPTVEAKPATPAAGSSAKAKKRPNKRKADESSAKPPPTKAAKNDEATPKRKSGRPVVAKKAPVKDSPVIFSSLFGHPEGTAKKVEGFFKFSLNHR